MANANSMLTEDILKQSALGVHRNWTLADAVTNSPKKAKGIKLPLASFNHIAREVLSIEKSKYFYVEVLGFTIIPRPPFDCEGYWLYGYGLSLHLVETTVPEERKRVKLSRIKHFSTSLPRVDHVAFVTSDINFVKGVLEEARVFFKEDCPADTGIRQIFLFDPDGNVIEISNCSPEIGETRCVVKKSESIDHNIAQECYSAENARDSKSSRKWLEFAGDPEPISYTNGNYSRSIIFFCVKFMFTNLALLIIS